MSRRGVDVSAIVEIHELIQRLADEGKAVVISSYLPESALSPIADESLHRNAIRQGRHRSYDRGVLMVIKTIEMKRQLSWPAMMV